MLLVVKLFWYFNTFSWLLVENKADPCSLFLNVIHIHYIVTGMDYWMEACFVSDKDNCIYVLQHELGQV